MKHHAIDLTQRFSSVLGGTGKFRRCLRNRIDRAGKGSACWTVGTERRAVFMLHSKGKYTRVGGSLRAGSPASPPLWPHQSCARLLKCPARVVQRYAGSV